MSKTEKTIYEIGYHLIPTVSSEDVAKEVGLIKEKIVSSGGEIISEEYPNLIKLAYEMTKEIDNKNVKFNSAFFGWVKFELEPEQITEMKKMVDANANILRFIIIKTVRENTIYSPKLSKTTRKTSGADILAQGAESLPIDEEAVNQKIEELIEKDAAL